MFAPARFLSGHDGDPYPLAGGHLAFRAWAFIVLFGLGLLLATAFILGIAWRAVHEGRCLSEKLQG